MVSVGECTNSGEGMYKIENTNYPQDGKSTNKRGTRRVSKRAQARRHGVAWTTMGRAMEG